MADDQFDDVPDIVPISATGGDEPAQTGQELVAEISEPLPEELPPPEGFSPKEIQGSVFSASIQIYTSRKEERDYDGKLEAIEDAATIFAVCGNKQLMGALFEKITTKHSHPYDVFARAEMEIEGMFQVPSES